MDDIIQNNQNNINFHSGMIELIDDGEPRNSHRELFNKLVASQSQPTIMSIASNSSNNMTTSNDCNHHQQLHHLQPQTHHQQTVDYLDISRCSSAIEPSSSYQLATNGQPIQSNNNHNQQQHQHQQQRAQQQQPQRRCSSLSGPSSSASTSTTSSCDKQAVSLDYRNVCDLLPEDFKKEPVVFSSLRNRWYTNEEVASILTNFESHPQWQTMELQLRPKSGAVYLYSRDKVRYRQDGYCWKKRKNGRTTREDHMKLKVQGVECIYGCYVHSAILPTFHRRCYWLLQNPDIVLVHYLNQPADEQNKMMITFDSSSLEAFTRRSWTNEEIIEEIGSVFGGISHIKHMLNMTNLTNNNNNNNNNIINQTTTDPLLLVPQNNQQQQQEGGIQMQQQQEEPFMVLDHHHHHDNHHQQQQQHNLLIEPQQQLQMEQIQANNEQLLVSHHPAAIATVENQPNLTNHDTNNNNNYNNILATTTTINTTTTTTGNETYCADTMKPQQQQHQQQIASSTSSSMDLLALSDYDLIWNVKYGSQCEHYASDLDDITPSWSIVSSPVDLGPIDTVYQGEITASATAAAAAAATVAPTAVTSGIKSETSQ